MKLFLVLLGLVALAVADKVKYDNYKVYRITPRNEEERSLLLDLQENNPGVQFWKGVRKVGLPVDIMIPPHLQPDIVSGLQTRSFNMYEMINDVQSLINVEAMIGAPTADAPQAKINWTAYHPYADILEYLDEVVAENPAIASVSTYGKSYEGRDLRVLKLNKGNTKKPVIFLDANIHAREWITNAICTYTINELVKGTLADQLNDFNFYIIPVMNPDGYEYSRTSDRMWRKTRSPAPTGICRGADPNRNFGFGFNTGGSSNQPCSDTYMGRSAFSEPETLAASQLMDQIQAEEGIRFYLSLHSYSQLILIPYGTALGRVPDHQQHMDLGNAAAAAIAKRYGTQFTAGNIVDLLYVASGASVDYMKGTHDTDVAYTFEMRDTGAYGFVLPPAQIVPSSLEFIDGLIAILDRLKAADK
jgi:murein tripeptide amidase MpaA